MSVGRRRPDASLARYRDSAQIRLAPELAAGELDRVFEGQVLERVEGVVMDEDADGALGGQPVRQVVEEGVEVGGARAVGAVRGRHRSLRV